MAEKKRKPSSATITGDESKSSAAGTMQDLLMKLQAESGNAGSTVKKSVFAPKYDENSVANMRRQLIADYRLEPSGGEERKRTAPRANLYEYEDLSVEMSEVTEDAESVDEEVTAEEAEIKEAAIEDEPIEKTVEELPPPEEDAVQTVEFEDEEDAESVDEEVTAEEAEVKEAAIEDEPIEKMAEELPPAEEDAVQTVEFEDEEDAESAGEEVTAEEAEVKEAAIEDEPIEKTVEELPPAEEEKLQEESEDRNTDDSMLIFRAASSVSVFRKNSERKESADREGNASKQKDLYSVYDYDAAQEFGYTAASREATVGETNEMDIPVERHITIFTNREQQKSEETQKTEEKHSRVMNRFGRGGTHSSGKSRQNKRTVKNKRRKPLPEPGRISETEDARIHENADKVLHTAIWRMAASGIIAVVLLFWEYLPMIPGSGYMLFGFIGNTQYPYLYIGIAALFLIFSVAILWKPFFCGVTELLSFSPTPRSVTAFAVLLAILNDIFLFFVLRLDPGLEYATYHYPAALCLFFYAIGSYSTVRRKGDAFHVFGSDRMKYLLVDDELCEQIRNHKPIGAPDEEDGKLCRFASKREVRGVERRFGAEDRYDGFRGFRMLFFVLIMLGIGAMLVCASQSSESASILSRVSESVRAFLWTVFLSLPLAVTEVRRIPLAIVSGEMRKKNTALAGDAAAAEYAGLTRIAIRSESFLRRYPICFGEFVGENPREMKQLLSSVFMALGDPFSRAVRTGGVDTEFSEDVLLLRVSEREVTAYVDSLLVSVCLAEDEKWGSVYADRRAAPSDSAYRLPLCISVEGRSVGTCFCYLQNDAEYLALIRELCAHELKIDALHYTFLPFLSRKTLRVPYARKNNGPKVLNLSADKEAERIQLQCARDETADSGIIALNTPRDIWMPLLYAKKITAYNRFSAGLSWVSLLVGACASMIVAAGVLSSTLYPFLFFLLPLLFGAFTYLFSGYFLD